MSDKELDLLEQILSNLQQLNAAVTRISSFILEISPAEAEKEISELEEEMRSIWASLEELHKINWALIISLSSKGVVAMCSLHLDE